MDKGGRGVPRPHMGPVSEVSEGNQHTTKLAPSDGTAEWADMLAGQCGPCGHYCGVSAILALVYKRHDLLTYLFIYVFAALA